MPVFAFAACQYPFAEVKNLVVAFVAIHLFLYPASNGYNSYYDKDTGSIGGLEFPPQVKTELYYFSLAFDVFAIALGLVISWQFAVMLLIYGLVSKAYSHPSIRLKKYGVLSLITASVFQGGFTYMMSHLALHHTNFQQLNDVKIIVPALLSSAMIMGFYPMTQIYQHTEDQERGDRTISIILGANGTFIFSAVVFLLANIGFYLYFQGFYGRAIYFVLFQVFLSPLYAFFVLWYFAFLVDKTEANFRNVMILNKIASACLVAFFVMVGVIQNFF